MNIFFDMDYTLLGGDWSLRPGTHEVLQRLVDDHHRIYIWSGVGTRWDEVRMHNLTHLVTDCFKKPWFPWGLPPPKLVVPILPDFVIDDNIEVVSVLGGICVSPYWSKYWLKMQPDHEMQFVYEAIREYVETGGASHPGFIPPGGGPLLPNNMYPFPRSADDREASFSVEEDE